MNLLILWSHSGSRFSSTSPNSSREIPNLDWEPYFTGSSFIIHHSSFFIHHYPFSIRRHKWHRLLWKGRWSAL